jgi:hypothetical protein
MEPSVYGGPWGDNKEDIFLVIFSNVFWYHVFSPNNGSPNNISPKNQ